MALSQADITAQLQKHFAPDLLDHAVAELRLNEFAKQADLPKNAGSKTIKWGRKRAAVEGNVQTLTEGTPSDITKHKIGYEYVEADLVQYGDVYEQTDLAGMTGLFNFLKDSIGTMGEEAALKADSVTRNSIISGIQTVATSKRYAQGAASFAALLAGTASAGALVGKDLVKCATQLRVNRSPLFNGTYVAIIPPQGSYDFTQDGDWKLVSAYSAAKQIFKGEIGMWHNVRFVEATNPFVEGSTSGEGTYDANGLIYTTLVFGKDAFGTPKLAGTTSPWKPQVIVLDKPDKSDPLNQVVNAGYKIYWNSLLLNPNFVIGMRHKTTFA